MSLMIFVIILHDRINVFLKLIEISKSFIGQNLTSLPISIVNVLE